MADCLLFREAEGTDLKGTDQSLISFVVPHLEESARILNAEISRGPNGEEARGRDPDGRWVLIKRPDGTTAAVTPRQQGVRA